MWFLQPVSRDIGRQKRYCCAVCELDDASMLGALKDLVNDRMLRLAQRDLQIVVELGLRKLVFA